MAMSTNYSENNSSGLWFRIANLRPKLRDHISIQRQEYRGEIWYVYQDHATNRYHRFDYAAHEFIGLMNGNRSVQDIQTTLKAKNNSLTPTQDELLQLLGQLHQIDLLQTNTTPDTEELYQRAEKANPKRWKAFLRNPISLRFSLLDPEDLLTTAMPKVKPVFNWIGFTAWLLVSMLAIMLAVNYWAELSGNAIQQALMPTNILLLAILYPFVKLLHELGHAFAVKNWGGEVHEIGIILVLLIPIPFVDASAASAFIRKYQRIIVGSIGIMVEMFIASIALFVWLGVEPGLVRTIAYDVMLISGVSTLLFNGNPLLRYDGYYVLSDAIGIPNLASRSNRYIGYLIQRYLLNSLNPASPVHDPSERYWLFFYAPAAFIYRMFILSVIIFLVADKAFLVGVILGCWLIYNQLVLPILKHLKFILNNPKNQHNRQHAIVASGAVVACLTVILFILPFPLVTIAQGVIWLPENSKIRANTNGFITNIFVGTDSIIIKGEKIAVLEDPLLETRKKVLLAQLQDLNAQHKASWANDRVQTKIIKEQILSLQASIKKADAEIQSLIIRSPENGKIIIPNAHDLAGQYLKKGDFIGYIVPSSSITGRVVIQQKDMGLLGNINQVDVILSGDMSTTIPASINRIMPKIHHQLPNAALGTNGGGNLSVDPLDKTGLKSLEKIQQIEIVLNAESQLNTDITPYIGKKIYVRLDHGTSPLIQQWYKSLQQLFLRRFSV
jgi:putative peptide zinc metalloprotease protein